MELLIFIVQLLHFIPYNLFKFQYGATNILPYFLISVTIYTFKFQYGATNMQMEEAKKEVEAYLNSNMELLI